jgi:dTDP-4-amino-4,6-dideoxygalactose transaminase
LPLSTPKQVSNRYSGFHLYIIQLNLDEITQSKRTVFEYMRKQKIEVNLHYIPVHTQPYYQRMGFKVGDYPHSENYSNRAITLPLFPALTHNEQDYVVANLKKAVEA